jgi:hypothetical protein
MHATYKTAQARLPDGQARVPSATKPCTALNSRARVYPFDAVSDCHALIRCVKSILFSDCLAPARAFPTPMSRIFDELKHVERVRAGEALPKSPAADATEMADRRRSRRWALDISVYVYGHDPEQEPFHEEAHTLHVNANGALLLLSGPVRKGQQLLLTNQLTEEEQDCRVVYLGTRRSRTVEAGVAFPEPNPKFWRLPSPPEDVPTA